MEMKEQGKNATLQLTALASQLDCSALARPVLSDEGFALWTATANPKGHHYGEGGLAVHTREVVNLCLGNNRILGQPVLVKLLFIAALWHDYGKIWDYEPTKDGSGWQNTDHKYRIHHIQRSALEFQRAILSPEHTNSPGWLTTSQENEIVHAILAHHCQPDWGSPVRPHTTMAWILHCCDQMSARSYECRNGCGL